MTGSVSTKNTGSIGEVFKGDGPAFSFEFFPPKTEEASKLLLSNIKELMDLRPAYVSVTYGAGGSTRKLTQDLVVKLQKETELTIVSHLTCVGATAQELEDLLQKYYAAGIRNIMALRGDPPKGREKFEKAVGGLAFAGELVALIKRLFPDIGVGIAGFPEGHPETQNRLKEMDFLKWKVDQGADYICTQFFFDNRDFYDFCERCELAGIRIPFVAGIMPITSLKSTERMAELALGSRFPARLLKALSRASDDEYAEKVGLHWATEQVRDLLDNDVDGVHFYTLNKSKATKRIYESLGLRNSDGLRSSK